jgi:hypothetical protein
MKRKDKIYYQIMYALDQVRRKIRSRKMLTAKELLDHPPLQLW